MKTIHRPIPGFPDYYAGMDGTIVSGKTGKVLKGGYDPKGYRKVTLYLGSRESRVIRKVATLVALSFLGPRPDGLLVLHGDDDKTNDSLQNLSYGTLSDNQYDSVRNGTHALASQTRCKNGHEFTPENTKITTQGSRMCRECSRKYHREWNRRRKLLTTA